MNRLHKERIVENKWTDLTKNYRLERPNKMQIESIEEHNYSLVYPEISIKTEPQEDDSDMHVTPENSSQIYTDYDVKDESDELRIKIERDDLFDESMQDPLYIGDEIKGENDEHFSEPRSNIGKNNNKKRANKNLERINKLKYSCDVCNKLFKERCTYEVHLRIHTGEKPFTCDICQKSFNRSTILKDHMVMHSGEKPHECDICKKRFRYRAGLGAHKWIHSSVKPYNCTECDKSFSQKPHYIQHLRVHTGFKPYACDFCEQTFTHKLSLTSHRRFHTGETPYTCDVCNKSFTRISTLTRHKKIHKN